MESMASRSARRGIEREGWIRVESSRRVQNDARDTRAAVDATLERKSGVGLPPPDAGRRGRLRPSPPRESAARFSWDASMRRASLAHDHFASGRAPSSRRMSLASFVSRRTIDGISNVLPPRESLPFFETKVRSSREGKKKNSRFRKWNRY